MLGPSHIEKYFVRISRELKRSAHTTWHIRTSCFSCQHAQLK